MTILWVISLIITFAVGFVFGCYAGIHSLKKEVVELSRNFEIHKSIYEDWRKRVLNKPLP